MPNHPTWNYAQTKENIASIPDEGLRTYAQIGYLLGGRIMENLTIRPKRISIQDSNKGTIILTSVNSLKTREGPYQYRHLPNILEEEPYYAQQLVYFQECPDKEISLKEYLGIGGKRAIEKKMQRSLGIVPHSLRHLRATHMGHNKIPSSLHKPTGPYLKYYFGWKFISAANDYIDQLHITDIYEQSGIIIQSPIDQKD